MSAAGDPALPLIPVACGVLVNGAGEVLMAQRPEGKIAAGYWEFPGGKIEPGEAPQAALRRELHEELGVTIAEIEPLIDFEHGYSDRRVRLQTFRCRIADGRPQGREGQALAWRAVADLLDLQPQLPTVAPILTALRLPAHYAWTPPCMDANRLAALPLPQVPPGSLVRLRQPQWNDTDYCAAAPAWRQQMQAAGLQPVLDRLAAMSGAPGVGLHLSAAAAAALPSRPVAAGGWLLVSAHDDRELQTAARVAADAVVIGHVAATPSHAESAPLGWRGFTRLARLAGRPTYAIGGLMAERDHAAARLAGAQGIAGIRTYWPQR